MDASVLIAHLSAADAHHEDATAILSAAAPGSMLVHALTLAEVLVGAVRVSALAVAVRRRGVVVVGG